MRAHYDFSKMKWERNPYYPLMKRPITIRIELTTIDYFKALAAELGMPYQNLINLYLRDCAQNKKRLDLSWRAAPEAKVADRGGGKTYSAPRRKRTR